MLPNPIPTHVGDYGHGGGRALGGPGAAVAPITSNVPVSLLQEVDLGLQQAQHASGPRRHDVLFASLFKPNVFPRFFRVLEECDIDLPRDRIGSTGRAPGPEVPSAAGLSAHTAPVSDSATSTSIAITDEGFRKMGECYIVRNRAYQRERNFGDRAYSYQNLSKFLKSNKDKKNNDSKRAAEDKSASEAKSFDEDKSAAEDKSASEAKSVEAQPNPQAQDEYSQELLALVLSLPQALSENYPQAAAADESQAVVAFSAVMASVLLTMPKLDKTDAFFSFCAWLLNHCTIPHQRTDPTSDQPSPHQCRAETILHNFASDPDNCENFEHMVSLVRFCHLLRFWHRDSNYSFAAKSQCIFELCYCSSHISMFNLCSEKDAARSLQECLKLINLEYLAPEARSPSPLTARWILLAAGRSVKQWGHHSSHEFERCEVEKESNFCEKWRHLIFSYAVMSLLYNEFNGNKLGPIGNYHFREKCKIGPVGSSSEKFVYASKTTNDGTPYEASDYLGHNIVALAVCKRGSILRVSYNHNVLFSSTVDHAEERLIDGLFKDPSAFIEKSHAEIFKDGQRVNIEEHMKHISVYTSLEPCQQCSGKLHIAEVPELVFCQRDWEIQLLQAHLYEKFRKCRSIPASNFEFTPYQELSSGYYNFQNDRRKNFFSLEKFNVGAKATMPYFLCTDYAQMIFRLGHKVFEKDLQLLFLGGKTYTEDDLRKFADEDGLISAHEWLEEAENIRDYRPLLNRKQMRVLHDELSSSRVEWIQLCHKRECSVMMQFDPNSNVTEHAIDLHFASLVDIKSIYLPRDLDGSLKGTATLVCASPAAAKKFLALFKLSSEIGQGHIEEYLNHKGEIAIKQNSDLSKLKKDFLKKAAEWMYLNRRIQAEELIVPFYSTEFRRGSDCSPAARPSPRACVYNRTALLVEWHQKRIGNNETIKQVQSEISEISSALQSSAATTASEKKSTKKKLVVVSEGSNGRDDAVNYLRNEVVMYIVVKNTNGAGWTLCQWVGKDAPANQKQGSKRHPAQVQRFLVSFISKLDFDKIKYETQDDFRNPSKRDASSDKEDAKSQKKKDKKERDAAKRDVEKVQRALDDICFEDAVRVSQRLLSMDKGGIDEADWMVLQYTEDTQWEESYAFESPPERKESLETELVKLRANSLLFDIEYEQKLASLSHPDPAAAASECNNIVRVERLGQQVFCFKANNSFQARRLRQMLPNLDAPNHTVLWSCSAPSSVFSQTDGKGSTVSLIVRDDVTDASVMQFLQKILDTDLLPIVRSRSKENLRACDCNSNGIKWLDINGAAIECRKWKLHSFQFRSRIEVDYNRYLAYFPKVVHNKDFHPLFFHDAQIGQNKDFHWDSERFYQPFSQPVLDLIFLRADFQSFRKLKFDIKEMIENHFVFKQGCDPPKQLLLTVTGSERTHFFVSQNGKATISKHVSDDTRKKMKYEIEIDQNFLANFLFSDALRNPLIRDKFQSILEYGKNFWGHPISFRWNKLDSQKSGHVVLQPSVEAKADAEAKAAGAREFWEVLEIWRNRAVISILEHSQPLESLECLSSSQDSITASGTIKWPSPAEVVDIRCSASVLACKMEMISCRYCGCNYVIPECVREALVGDKSGQGVFCCISHADREEKRAKLLMPISDFNKPDKATQSIQDPARDKNLAKLFQRICEIEKLLRLNISIGFQHLLYFKCSERKSSSLRIEFQFLRDEYDGPAHLSFCVEGPTDVLCQSSANVKEPSATEARKTHSKKKADKTDYMRALPLKEGLQVLISSSIDGMSHFKTSLSVYPEFHEHETPLCFGDGKQKIKTPMCRIYGRVAPKNNGTENGVASDNEGNKLPAEWMRRVLEPEYYQSSTAVFPVVKFELTVPQCGAASVSGDYITYIAESALSYSEELGSNDKHSRPEDKTKKDNANSALSCFREVLNAESQLNAVTASRGLLEMRLNQQLQKSFDVLNGTVAGGISGIEDEFDDGEDDDDGDGDDNGDEETSLQIDSIPKCVWVVFLKRSSKRGCWMELFHSPQKSEPDAQPFFSDILRVQLDQQHPEGQDTTDFSCFCPNQRAQKNLSSDLLVKFFKLIRQGTKKYEEAFNLLNSDSADRGIFDGASSSSSHYCPSSHQGEDSVFATSASPEHLSPFVVLAKSLMDQLMTKCDEEASEISADVPICIFMQKKFRKDVKEFLFDPTYQKTFPHQVVTVSAEISAMLSRFLLPTLDLSFQHEAKQKNFVIAIDKLLGVGPGQEDNAGYGIGALAACKTIPQSIDNLKLLEAFKYFLFSDDLLCKIRPDHIIWLSEMGQQLERRCEFASALKYYYTGKVYYAKLDKFGLKPRGPDSKLTMEGFETNPPGLYETMFQALQEVANMEEHKNWAKKHWASWATNEHKETHLKECLNLSDSDGAPCLQAVLENAAKHLSVHFHFQLLPGAARSSDPHVLLSYSKSNSKFGWKIQKIQVEEEEKHGIMRKLFEQLFERLLPYSNKEAYENALESVHFQKVVLRRGTMSK